MAAEWTGASCPAAATVSPVVRCPPEILQQVAPRLLDRAQPVGRLACASRALFNGLRTCTGRLRVGSIVALRLDTLKLALSRASPADLDCLCVDFFSGGARYCRQELEAVLQELGQYLASAASLRGFCVRLTSFDSDFDRLRLSPQSWEALVRGLNGLAQHKKLRVLELSHFTIKESLARQLVDPPGAEGSKGRVLRRAATSPGRTCMILGGEASGCRADVPSPRTGGDRCRGRCTATDLLGGARTVD